jgi:serine protease
MLRRPSLLAVLGLALAAPAARAADHVPGEVVVRTAPGATVAQIAGTSAAERVAPRTRVVKIRDGRTVREAIRDLERRPGVQRATPNLIAHTAFVPNDPGRGTTAGDWERVQWNFAGPFGVNAPGAWDNLRAVGRDGGAGVVVAVLDTGVAYEDRGVFVHSPDLLPETFVPGHDFVDGDDFPTDMNGHGTHVASTIAETIDNGVGVTGLAYGARIMPVRVLDAAGYGDIVAISRGVRWAVRNGAQIINLSFEFGTAVRARQIPDLLGAVRYARSRGVLVVAASGNDKKDYLAYPARAGSVLSVGATTHNGCIARYSNGGPGLDLVAPGGGRDKAIRDPNCHPLDTPRSIVQMTFDSDDISTFGLPRGYRGTSMAAPHVSATAALVIASGVLGPDPTPAQIEDHLEATARDLGAPGADNRYGAGLIDAAAATASIVAAPPEQPQP